MYIKWYTVGCRVDGYSEWVVNPDKEQHAFSLCKFSTVFSAELAGIL